MNKKHFYKIRQAAAGIVFLLAVLGLTGSFYPVKIFDIQIVPLIQRVIADFSGISVFLLAAVFVLTLFWGRLYCSVICPFGIMQEIVLLIKSKLNKKRGTNISTKPVNFALKYFIAAIAWGIFFGGSTLAVGCIDPYTLFTSPISKAAFGLISIVIIAAAVIFKNRIFCTNFCPAGTILGLISKFSVNKIYMNGNCVSCGMCAIHCSANCINTKENTVDNEICIKCLKCTNICPENAILYGTQPKITEKFNPKRRRLIIGAAALIVFGLMIKTGIVLKDKITEKIKDVILPPGAVNKQRFASSCLNCSLCVQYCPNKIIKKADKEYNIVHLDYSKNSCRFDCNKCSQVCPSGAIKHLTIEQKQKIKIADAVINDDRCVNCGDCLSTCPVHAIIREKGHPVIEAMKCIGCGACKNTCFVDAIEVSSVTEQKEI